MARLGRWLVVAFVLPFVDFIKRYRYDALLLLALIGSYRISDVVMGVMANPFTSTWDLPRRKLPPYRKSMV